MIAVQEQKQENQNAHVYAFRNEEYYKTSKVETPQNTSYRKTYSERILKVFEEFKREFTYESQKQKVKISYLDMEKDYLDPRRQIFSIVFEENLDDSKKIQSNGFSKNQRKRIEEILPKGFKLESFETSIFFYKDEDPRNYFGKIPEPKVQTKITYEKEGKKTK